VDQQCKDFQDQEMADLLKRPIFCQNNLHGTEELEFFCEDCQVPICNKCALTRHEGHAKTLLEEAANERKLRVNSVIESQKQKAVQKRNKIAKLEEEQIKIQAQVAIVKRNVQNFVDNMIKVLEEKKQKIFDDVEDEAKESLERLRIKQLDMEHELQRIETAIEKTETLLKQGTSAEIVQLDTTLVLMFLEGVRDERTQVEDLGCFIFVKNKTFAKAIHEGIGSVKTFLSKTKAHQSIAEGKGTREATVGLEAQLVLTTRNAEGERCYEEFDCVTVEIRNHQGDDCATKVKVQDNKDGTYNISYFAKESDTCQASVMVNGEHVLGSPFPVQVKNRQYKPVLSFGLVEFDGPWGMAVNERDEIAVTNTDNKKVQIFSSDGTHLRCFGGEGDQEGEFNSPLGITFLNNENIAVADRYNQRVQICTKQGEYLSHFGGEGNLDHQLDNPWGLSVDSDGNIIVADLGNQLIKIFSPSGHFIRKFDGEGSLKDPCHCIQKDKYFVVSDAGDYCIKVFDVEGKFLHKFGDYGEQEGESSPLCLSVDKAGHLLVCAHGSHKVQVFELSGKFIGMFGRYGGKIGEFHRPTSTAVLTDGRIVVCDFGNNRIQIFE